MEQNIEFDLIEGRRAPGFHVFCGEHAAGGLLLKLCARFAVEGPVNVLDFGNRCDMYFTARELRVLTRDPVAAMQNIHLRRAFTCYQALTLLEKRDVVPGTPLLILDLLPLFLDDNIQQKEAERLFYSSLYHISKLSQDNAIFIGVKPLPRIASARSGLMRELQLCAGSFQQLLPVGTKTDQLEGDKLQMSLF